MSDGDMTVSGEGDTRQLGDLLTISVTQMKRADLIKLSGRIDSSNAGNLDDEFRDLIDAGRENFVLDLSEVEYMSSAGLRSIVALKRESKKTIREGKAQIAPGDVKIASPSQRVSEVLELAGLTELFEIYEDRVTAVGSF